MGTQKVSTSIACSIGIWQIGRFSVVQECRGYRRHARLGVAWRNFAPSTQGPGVGLGDPVSPVLPLGGGRPRLLKSGAALLSELYILEIANVKRAKHQTCVFVERALQT